MSDLPFDQSGKFAGWIAFYNGKKLEIRKDQADNLWQATKLARKNFNVPKSKIGLMAIEPAHEEVKQ